jgi:putative PIG3 family NAD(P)H quinone oxidoreductase
MHAIVITEPGGPDVLTWQQVPDPVPGPDEVVIDIAASAVNRADLAQRQGFYPPPPGAPPYPGLECAGAISRVGENVTAWHEGDEVCALLSGGGYAEQVAVPQGQLLPKPANLTIEAAAALPEVVCTVYANIFQFAKLAKGELILIHGGSSGIGTMAIQLAKAAGARVAVTARSEEKLAKCRELGADITINYKTADFAEALRDQADVILDIMGASYLGRNLDALAVNGRLAIIGLQGGARAELDLSVLHRKRGAIYASTIRARPHHEKAQIVAGVRRDVWPLVEAGQVMPVIDTELPVREAARAHQLMAGSAHVGKIVLLVPR